MSDVRINRFEFEPECQPVLDAFGELPKTEQFGKGKFPSAETYASAIGSLAAESGLASEDAAAVAQRDWHIRGQNGCQFARLVARDAMGFKWDYVTVGGDVSAFDAGVYEEIGERTQEAVDDPETHVSSILVPGIHESVSAESFIRGLVANTDFWLERDEVADDLLRLNLRLPVKDDIQAWVMAFAPFDYMPNTRRGPSFELALRTKEKPDWLFHRLNHDRGAAHLADTPLEMPDNLWETRFDSTIRRTRDILGGEPDDVSAAKATLSIPVSELSGRGQ